MREHRGDTKESLFCLWDSFFDAIVCLPNFTFLFSATFVCFEEDVEQTAVCLPATSIFISFSHVAEVKANHPPGVPGPTGTGLALGF